MNYWIFKSEPDAYGWNDLLKEENQTEHWDGVRNYQARNFLRDKIKIGDKVFFYHSNCKIPGIIGVTTVVKNGYPDHTAFDSSQKYYDPKSDPENPRWFMVDIKAEKELPNFVSLHDMKSIPELTDMKLLKKGNRLSVLPIEKQHFEFILRLGNA